MRNEVECVDKEEREEQQHQLQCEDTVIHEGRMENKQRRRRANSVESRGQKLSPAHEDNLLWTCIKSTVHSELSSPHAEKNTKHCLDFPASFQSRESGLLILHSRLWI